MNRLTKRIDENKYASNVSGGLSAIDCFQKLGQLEDIENELGIDLITLFKALRDGFIARYRFDFEFSKCVVGKDGIMVDFKNKCFSNNFTDDWYFKDYGKTWALTKEELETKGE